MRIATFTPLALLALLALPACVSEADLREDWLRHVDANNACDTDADCAVIFPGCPLGCYAAVRADAVEACRAEADALVGTYESGGRTCDYDCPATSAPYCDDAGRCAVEGI